MKGHAPKNPLESPRFGDISTFARLPHTRDLKGVDAAIVGVPFDGGTTYRPGARFAPRAIRVASCMNRNVHPEYSTHIYEKLSVVDYGDINCNPLNLKKTFGLIEKTYETLTKANVIPIALGGDHSIIIPILQTLKKKHKKFGLIQFDAHTDTADQAWGEQFHHGTPIRRLIEDGTLSGKNVFQIGIRGAMTSADQLAWDKSQGITHWTAEDLHYKGIEFLAKKIKSQKIPYYITFDIDGVDPAFAPGTGTPVVGGPSSLEVISALRGLRGIDVIGCDLVEVSPAYDHSEITTLLASTLLFEMMALIAETK